MSFSSSPKNDGSGSSRNRNRSCDDPNKASLSLSSPAGRLSLYHELEYLLYSSYLIQDIALFNHWHQMTLQIRIPAMPSPAAAISTAIAPTTPLALLDASLEDPDFFKTFPRSLSQVQDWFQKNHNTLRQGKWQTWKSMDVDFDLQGLHAIQARTSTAQNIQPQPQNQHQRQDEPTIELLDDEFGFQGHNSNLVYGIVRNPSQKHILVVFRGSVSVKDWEQDANVQSKEALVNMDRLRYNVPNPKEELLEGFRNIHVHSGFYDYLFGTGDHKDGNEQDDNHPDKTNRDAISNASEPQQRRKPKEPRKFQHIVQKILKHLRDPRNEGYSLCFTGHSLGGALATLSAYTICVSQDLDSVLPIKLVTFASPHVAKLDALQLFDRLCEVGRIEHLRVTNDDDMVPQGLRLFGYRHNGLHLNLGKTSYTLEPSKPCDESIFRDTKISPTWLVGNPSHKLQEHHKRLEQLFGKEEHTLSSYLGHRRKTALQPDGQK